MAMASAAQLQHIMKLHFADSSLARFQMEEVYYLLSEGRLTREVAQDVIEGRHAFEPWIGSWHDQVERLYRLFGTMLGFGSRRAYESSIPLVPKWSEHCPAHLNRIVLVDRRPLEACGGYVQYLKLLGFELDRNGEQLNSYIERNPEVRSNDGDVYWMRCDDGRRHNGRDASDFWKNPPPKVTGLDVIEGAALVLSDRDVVRGHVVDLPGTVDKQGRFYLPHLYQSSADRIFCGTAASAGVNKYAGYATRWVD